MLNPVIVKTGEWTLAEIAKLGRMPHRALRGWIADARLRRGQDAQRQPGEWRKFRYADMFHLIVVGYLVRYGASPEEASRVVAKHIDPRTHRYVLKGDDTANDELFDMKLMIRVKDDGYVESIAVFDKLKLKPEGKITQSDHGAFVRIGAVIKELIDSIVAAETERSTGSA